MNRYAYLFDGLAWKRVLLVTALCFGVSALLALILENTYPDLVVSALCVGYTNTLLFTVATNLRGHRLPRWAIQVASIVIGSFLGTMLTIVVKGRDIATILAERYDRVMVTTGLGIGIGCVVLWVLVFRERESRRAAELARAQAERAQLEKNVLQARLALMQAQVEPHFLFNTLANVQHLVETDPASASRMLESLIQYLRAALPRMREDTTTVGRELDMAKSYLDIHRMRMGTRLDYAIDVPAELRSRPFPPMMLISLVENAVIHGVDPCCECGTITIRATEEGGMLRVSVADTGEGISTKKGGGVGLTNIRERLKTLYGTGARLVMEENVPRGVVAAIELDSPAAMEAPSPVSSLAAQSA